MLGLEAEADPRGGWAPRRSSPPSRTRSARWSRCPTSRSEEPLRLQAEVEQAFEEAAARHLPRQVLRADLARPRPTTRAACGWRCPGRPAPASATASAAGSTRCASAGPGPGDRPGDGEDTLEERLLDERRPRLAGAGRGPHVRGDARHPPGPPRRLRDRGRAPSEAPGPATDEFEELTPEVASRLLGRPGLGRHVRRWHAAHAVARPGHRLFRVAVPAARCGAGPRLAIRSTSPRPSPAAPAPAPQRAEAHQWPERSLADGVPASGRRPCAAGRSARARQQPAERPAARPGTPGHPCPRVAAAAAGRPARRVGRWRRWPSSCRRRRRRLGTAAKDPAPGLTLTFAFSFATEKRWAGATPGAPTLTIRPGYAP